MSTLGARLLRVAAGEVELEAPFAEALTQQHGYLHGGVVTALVDVACGYSAMTLVAPDKEVLSVEYQINFLAPAVGEWFIARGRVVRSGRTITVCSGELVAVNGSEEKQVAVMLATMMAV